MSRSQRGLSFLGALIVLAIAAAAGYYVYKWAIEGDDAPTCKNDMTACMRMCRRMTSESAEAQKCQAACEREAAECERKISER
jgi:hypothetical protein